MQSEERQHETLEAYFCPFRKFQGRITIENLNYSFDKEGNMWNTVLQLHFSFTQLSSLQEPQEIFQTLVLSYLVYKGFQLLSYIVFSLNIYFLQLISLLAGVSQVDWFFFWLSYHWCNKVEIIDLGLW